MNKVKINYVNPSVKVIDGTLPNLGYFIWLKSRQWIIEDESGNKFMVDRKLSHDWYSKIPDKFKVGNEVVNKDEYKSRIDVMNLQYNNLEYYILEIQGSCLFRDILFTINRISEWAQSNRFLFSILDDDARYKSENYKVSSEYKGIKEWESQFYAYMEAINNDPIVDHNRLEMPYSISSEFWIGVNKKLVYDLLSLLKNYMPFFYGIYGKLFVRKLNLDWNNIPSTVSASMTQYFMKGDFKEGSYSVNGTIINNSKMALILYSQFIRQADTRTTGYFNILTHTDINEFKHQVFKGGTVFNTHFVADIDKVRSTCKTRLCAFAMSSGNGPESWNYFLSKFIPKNISPKDFMDLLPCKFDNYNVTNCKFKDDVKFRNEGLEVSNCPCPLITKSLPAAINKRNRDNNSIGEAYYNLTEYLLARGLPKVKLFNTWTSEFVIRTESELGDNIVEGIKLILDTLESEYNKYNKTGKYGKKGKEIIFILSYLKSYFPGGDFTSAMKGLAIDRISEWLSKNNITSYIISFGGDVFVYNADAYIRIENTKFKIHAKGVYSIFTSGNTNKRGHHIVGLEDNSTSTLVINWGNSDFCNLLVDVLSTQVYAGGRNLSQLRELLGPNCHKYTPIWIDYYGDKYKLRNSTYIASPFFNDEQIEIRDKMAEIMSNPFRPDLTESSLRYDNGEDNLVGDVVNDNILGIDWSDFLVFPSVTGDLGTLFEVGHAIFKNKPIIKYIESSESYVFEFIDKEVPNLSKTKPYLFDLTKKSQVVSFGYFSNIIDKSKLRYELKGKPDNIMLSYKYTHVELINGKYKVIHRNEKERDK